MDFDLDDDERALRDGVREWARGAMPTERVRASAGSLDRDVFTELAQTGVFALRLPEEQGGLGLGVTHAGVVMQELGAALVPGPVVATHLAADRIDGAANGSVVVTEMERGARTLLHPDADVVVLVDDDGLWRARTAALDLSAAARPLDPITAVATVGIDAEGERIGGPADARRWREVRTCLVAALLVGTARASTDLMVRYAGEREQFGRSIGSFQAIKHLCADALTRVEVARAAVDAAACHLDHKAAGDGATAIAAAALLATEAAFRNAKSCIQVHGGMGFTWEVDAHLHLKRAVAWSAAVGGGHTHAEAIAATL